MTRGAPHFNDRRNPWANWQVTPGSHALDRVPVALMDPGVLIRPNTLAQNFAAAGRKLGARETPPSTPWARLFQGESAFLLAEILAFNAADEGFTFSQALESDPNAACTQLATLADRLKHWTARIATQTPDLFSKQLKQMDVEADLRATIDTYSGASTDTVVAVTTSMVRADFEADRYTAAKQDRAEQANLPDDPYATAVATRERLRNAHATLRNAVTTLKPQAQAAFDARIRSGLIDPSLGLLLAELRTAAHVDSALNTLPDMHRSHFYRDIVGQRPAPASAERVLLGLGVKAQAGAIAQGAVLEALLADGSVQRFETEAPVPLSPARISDLRVLSYRMDRNISFNKVLGGITRVRAATVKAGPQDELRPLFDAGATQTPAMGLDITSPMFSLAQGTRTVDVSLHMARGSNLPALSRAMTKEELDARTARWRKMGTGDGTPPKLRVQLAQDIHHTHPDVRLALSSDPELIAAFLPSEGAASLAQFAHELTEEAAHLGVTPSLSFIYEILSGRVKTEDQLRLLLGRLLTLSMIERVPLSTARTQARIAPLIKRFKFDEVDDGTSPRAHSDIPLIYAAFSANACVENQTDDAGSTQVIEDIFHALLGDALDIWVSTRDGPRRPDMMQILPLQDKETGAGITIRFRFDPDSPALECTEPRDTSGAPCLSVRAAAAPRVCPISIVERYIVSAIAIKTGVTGLRKVAAFSDDAPLVTDQTFQPFGPRPSDGASFQVGCAEMGRKPVTHIGISLGWAELPDPLGGFEAYYDAYGKQAELPKPEITLDYLTGGGWKAVITRPEPLFATDEITGALLRERRFEGRVTGHALPAGGRVTAAEYKSRQTVRAGLLRMTLRGTAAGFNAARYPQALVRAMRPRLLPLGPRPMPNAPFVPTAARVSVSYTATSRMELSAPDSAGSGETVTQIGPFGATPVFPARGSRKVRLFPKRLGYGQFYVQISGRGATGPIALVFDTAKAGHLRSVPKPNPITWYYLARTGWRALPDTALSSDTTSGLMRAGLILMDLPEDADPDPLEMPPGGVWIAAVAGTPALDTFPAFRDIAINGVWARRINDVHRDADAARTWRFAPVQSGITQVHEMSAPSALRPLEQPGAYLARVSERLRHRKRAVQPWDFERILLQEFPEVSIAKCLPHLSRAYPGPAPGIVTVVALRKPPKNAAAHAPCLFDVASLAQMQSVLSKLASGFATIEVVNPAFERLQVRGKIALDRTQTEGAMAQRLKDEITRYLSVWTAPAALNRFGWRLNAQLLRAHIAALPYVRGISDFSVLQLAGNDEKRYELLDTAQDSHDRRGPYGPLLRPRAPWSLPLSTPDHTLSLVYDLADDTPIAAGVGGLCVGEMLIVGQRTRS